MAARIAARHRLRVNQRQRIVEYAKEHGMKRENPSWACPRIAQQITLAF
jgi:hypothetical protein